MRKLGSRPLISAAFALVAIASLLLAASAQADTRMFRTSFTTYGAQGTQPGGLTPSLSSAPCGHATAPCPAASEGTTTPVAKFTIPPNALVSTYYTYSYTGYAGYTSLTTVSSYNGRGRFSPNAGPSAYSRVYFPTTGLNKAPHKASGNPATPTTTFGGQLDFSRAGSIQITPGVNRFGGTLQFLYGPSSLFKQKINTATGYYSKATGSFYCQLSKGSGAGARSGPLQACTLSGTSKAGVIGSSGMVTRKKYTSLGIVPIKTTGGVNNLTYKAYYLSLIAPLTTGKVYAQNPLNYKNQKFTATGYDSTFSTGTTRSFMYTNYNYNTTGTGTTTTTTTSTKQLTGITRISSMIRPRLRHTYLNSNDPPIAPSTNFQAARMFGLRVFFLPEPGGMLLIGAGVLGLASLTLLRRR